MKKDRTQLSRIISEMLDNPNRYDIYPTGKAYDELERYIEEVRIKALGWAYSDACIHIDKGIDY